MQGNTLKNNKEKLLIYVLDFVSLNLSIMLAFLIRFNTFHFYTYPSYVNTVFALSLSLIIVLFCNFKYQIFLRRGFYREFLASSYDVILTIITASFFLFILKKGTDFSRFVLIISGLFDFVFCYISRILYKTYIRKTAYKNNNKKSLVVIATSENAQKIIDNILSDKLSDYIINGIYITENNSKLDSINGIQVKNTIEDLLCYVSHSWVDDIIVCVPRVNDEVQHIIVNCKKVGITVHLNLKELTYLGEKNVLVNKISDYNVLSFSTHSINKKELLTKRVMDIAGGILGTVATGLLFIVMAPLIYVKSPGPIFFKQKRVGKNGRTFMMYKFRSMHLDAEERKKDLQKDNQYDDGFMFKIENDPRIIGNENGKGIGNFIRNTSIDEFPQFINVLKGDMSLVGTRPPTVDEWEKYELRHRKRLSIKPGITGLWQVSGRSSITDFEDVVKLDSEYIDNWNIGLDIKILFKTVFSVLKKDGI